MRSVYRHIPSVTVLYARSTGPYLAGASKAWDMMGSYLEKHKARRYMRVSYGLFRDNPRITAPELVRYDACIPLIPGLEADPALGIGRHFLEARSRCIPILALTPLWVSCFPGCIEKRFRSAD